MARCSGRLVQLSWSPLDYAHTDFLNPKITWLATALTWGSIRIIMDRNQDFDYHDPISPVSEDDVWGFGQVVAVALLLVPLFCFFESIYGKFVRSPKCHFGLDDTEPY